MKEVEVRLYANLGKYQPEHASGEALVIKLDDEAELGDLLNKLKIPREEVAIAMVNGKSERESYIIQDKDRIGIFPPIGGG